MIHTSLPLRPRISSRAEHLVTPLSIERACTEGEVKILNLTTLNLPEKSLQDSEVYQAIIREKIGMFDITLDDNDSKLFEYLIQKITLLNLYEKVVEVIGCKCGKYEELVGTRMFNLSKVNSNACVNCNDKLNKREQRVLFIDVPWQVFKNKFTYNRRWVEKDLDHFLSRQVSVAYKASKESEPLRIRFLESDYGLKHRIIWAISLVYLSDQLNENKINLHFVHQVSGIAFFVACLACHIKPNLEIKLTALPTIWLPNEISIKECSPEEISKLVRGLTSSRKNIFV